ncbi:major paralogous domain-containing protein [Fibrobacter sp. UWR3]|uniref:FISUMP domain-containing protein n=1 Tax=Fibrobacter sp. UWR3 TaxID=1896217 RepID=UPI0009117DE0|nr:FISUMP domain-containing protein [Fibrobacter sp. UWR3]SHM50883.1 major paralogous domain-containing protein [Fibrobacter sp. UWR3]
MKKYLAYVMLALIASLWGCSDMGDRDNPTDPGADNFDASLVSGDGNGGGDEPGDGGEGDDGKGSSSSNGISSNSSSSKGSSSSVTPKSSDSETSVSTGTMTDSRDGQTYKTVKIGDQVWMAQNLNYKSDNSYCYNDSAKYCSEYGRLYTWADAMESCPTGWHLPSKDEFVILANIAGGSSKAGKPLMAKDGWNSNGGGYDTYSFAALPGGARNEDGEYVLLGEQGSFWLASEEAFRFVVNNLPLYIAPNNRGRGLSVRCLKDAGQSLSSSSQSGVNSSSSGKVSVELGTFTDERDEQTYKTVKIGDQVWMAQNLNFKTDSSFCYNDEEANCTKYGRHYKWAAAVGKSESECGYGNECSLPSGDIQGACPSGWHLPSKTEWETLFTTVGGNSTAGKVLKSASGWNNSGNGTDAFEFTVLPAGGRYGSGNYSNEGKSAIFWSSTEFEDKDAYIVSLFYDGGAPYLSYAEKRYGYSVRCLMDTEQPSSSSSAISVLSPCKTADSDDCEYGTFTDERDGHTYKTVKIGDQEWMAENLNFDYNVGSAKSYCYDQSELNCDKYGRLYTWAAAMDSSAAFSNSAAGCGYLVDCSLSYPVRGVCPEGWILPDSTDMVKLIKAVGNYSVAGGTLRSVSQGGTDGYGFNFMMAGMRNNSGNYVNKDAIGYLWTSHPRGRYNADHILFEKVESARYYNNYRYNSFSVRCLKN